MVVNEVIGCYDLGGQFSIEDHIVQVVHNIIIHSYLLFVGRSRGINQLVAQKHYVLHFSHA